VVSAIGPCVSLSQAERDQPRRFEIGDHLSDMAARVGVMG